MSIRSFFKPKDGLPDPKGSLSSSLSSKAIALVNKEVEKAITSEKGKKRSQYKKIFSRLQHIDLDRCGAPSRISVFLQ